MEEKYFSTRNKLVKMPEMGYHRLVWLRKALVATQEDFVQYSAGDIGWLTEILQSITEPKKYCEFERYFIDDDVRQYITENGRHLPGLTRRNDMGHSAVWWATDLLDAAAVTVEAQRLYIRHDMVPRLAERLVQAIAELTPERAEPMSLEALKAAKDLAKVLVELDKLNEDEAKPFEERLNPSIDIFGDVSHDVLENRLHVAIRVALEAAQAQES